MFYDLSIFNKTNDVENFPHYFIRYSLFSYSCGRFSAKMIDIELNTNAGASHPGISLFIICISEYSFEIFASFSCSKDRYRQTDSRYPSLPAKAGYKPPSSTCRNRWLV